MIHHLWHVEAPAVIDQGNIVKLHVTTLILGWWFFEMTVWVGLLKLISESVLKEEKMTWNCSFYVKSKYPRENLQCR